MYHFLCLILNIFLEVKYSEALTVIANLIAIFPKTLLQPNQINCCSSAQLYIFAVTDLWSDIFSKSKSVSLTLLFLNESSLKFAEKHKT